MREGMPYIPYNFSAGPLERPVEEVIRRGLPVKEGDPGMNCQLYVSLIVRALGYRFPNDYRSQEWYEDPAGVLDVVRLNPLQEYRLQIQDGDVLGFYSKPDLEDKKRLHVGVARVTGGDIEILHASHTAKQVIITPFEGMGENPRYKYLYMISRPKDRSFPVDEEVLCNLGWNVH